MAPVTLVVGRNSLLARAFRQYGAAPDCRYVSHDELEWPGVLDGVGRIINFALHPDYRHAPYSPDIDIDLRLGQWAADHGLGYVMLSSRKVYAPESAFGVTEDGSLGPTDAYGRNKLVTERLLADRLGPRLTVLRIGNVIGYEREPGRRSFMGIMLGSLAETGRITLDVSPFVRRDFLPVEELASVIGLVLRRNLTGTYNVGSGAAPEVGRVALSIIEGFGRGDLLVTSPRHHDEFRLDISRLTAATGWCWPAERLTDYCRALGRRLAAQPAAGSPTDVPM